MDCVNGINFQVHREETLLNAQQLICYKNELLRFHFRRSTRYNSVLFL